MLTENYRNLPTFKKPEISFMPTLNIEGAMKARDDAAYLIEKQEFFKPKFAESLKLAVALSLYNVRYSKELNLFSRHKLEKRVIEISQNLVEAEKEYASSTNPLPTIGIEIETPRKPFVKIATAKFTEYASFFDVIGMPRNKINSTPTSASYWEFSPHPSYSPKVQARIISELIQGGFIPHLTTTQNPEDVKKKLDEKLVSMHINLGIPLGLENSKNIKSYANRLGEAIALAYTSSTRLEHRSSKHVDFGNIKSCRVIEKENSRFGMQRVELKAMEVLNPNTYYALYTSQAVFGLFFESQKGEYKSKLEFENLLNEVNVIFEKHYIKKDPRLEQLNTGIKNAYIVANLATNPIAKKETKTLLESYARRINKRIKERSKDSAKFQQPGTM